MLLAIAAGGALGALARYGATQAIHVAKDGFPWATFWTNISGAFALGLFLTFVMRRFPPSQYARAFVAIGFLAAYTTFSTMAVETVVLVKDGRAGVGVGYLVSSIALGLGVAYAGIVLGRRITRAPEVSG